MLILARYGELGLKSPQIKKKFEKKLVENLKAQLNELDCSVKCEFSRVYIDSKSKTEQVIAKVKNTPGIVSLSPCKKTTIELENMLKVCSKDIRGKKPKSFGLRVSRAGTHEFSSQDVAIKLGDLIRTKFNLKVNLTNPDLWINIEIRNKESFIFTDKIKCIGGLPVGIEGNILSLFVNKFDVYSAILMMKRGCKVYPLTFKKITKDQTEFLEILKKFDKDIKVLECKKENLDSLINLFNIKAVCSGETIEALEEFSNDTSFSIPLLHPICSMTKETVQDNLEKVIFS